ncbi:nucleoid-structuring protein H-NS [Mycolicibacterium sp. P1-5]|uniref:nucleoid-structuring protein H-NS n=1 Tax=Mycolicibacterium sp. P1-5 TaxID=2024617 RepID=UPI0011EE7DD6|nr:nucleoid-structuring protein H-NS [Mycolicibacterium sp. P1-5]KAA0105604.1 nucleoid-structuring protein H-NS [Mycolicibacterium sp. P1-5]
MADEQDRPDAGRDATPPGPPRPEKAAAKKQPAKKAPAKRAVKKAPAKKAPAKKAPAKKVAPPPPEPPAESTPLAAGNGSPPLAEGARAAAASAKASVEQAADPVSTPAIVPAPQSSRSPLPFAVAFGATVLIALLVHRIRARNAE